MAPHKPLRPDVRISLWKHLDAIGRGP